MTIENDILRHQVFLDRVARGFSNDYMDLIKRVVNKIRRLPAANFATSVALMQPELNVIFESATAEAVVNLQKLAEKEALFTRRLFRKYLDRDLVIPEINVIKDIDAVRLQTTFWKNAQSAVGGISNFTEHNKRVIEQTITEATINNENKATVNDRLADKTSGLLNTQSVALFGLAVLATSSRTRNVMYERNAIQRVKWLSVLEDNTCVYCEGLHGQVYELNNVPAFPAHARCQCTLIPDVD